MSNREEDQKKLLETAQKVFTTNYKPQPIVLRRGAGCTVWDVAGNKYLDLTGGIAACPLGHAHPVLATAIAEQALKLVHVSNLYFNEEQILLAERLTTLAADLGSPRAFFCNSGAEANEAAIKIAKRWQTIVRGRPERIEVFSFEGSFHGRTIATVALTGQEKYRSGFGPLVEWARFLPFPESEKDHRVLDQITERTCAVILEPIQAEGGIRSWPPGFLKALRERCSETGTALIFDEVQTGVGRTGTWFGFQQEGVVPDVISLAKGLGGGVPIGAIVASGELAQAFQPGTHASTFGGNPLACHAARTVIDFIEHHKVLERVTAAGDRLDRALSALMRRQPRIKEIRGRGLLKGALVDGDATPIVLKAREKGVLLSVAGGTVVRFAPPYVVTDEELDAGVAALDQALSS